MFADLLENVEAICEGSNQVRDAARHLAVRTADGVFYLFRHIEDVQYVFV